MSKKKGKGNDFELGNFIAENNAVGYDSDHVPKYDDNDGDDISGSSSGDDSADSDFVPE
jgi:hypothetical protein